MPRKQIQSEFSDLLVSELYHAISAREPDAKKIKSLIGKWREDHANIDLSTYHYQGGTSISSHGLFIGDVCLRHQDSAEVASVLLDEKIQSAELMPIYMSIAIISGDISLSKQVLALLPQHGFDLNSLTIGIYTPFSYAAKCAQPELIELLAEHGAKRDWKIEKGTPTPPLIALLDGRGENLSSLNTTFDALMKVGVKVRHHEAICERIAQRIGERQGMFHVKDIVSTLVNRYVANGLNLDTTRAH